MMRVVSKKKIKYKKILRYCKKNLVEKKNLNRVEIKLDVIWLTLLVQKQLG
jgi:hypothetical protein